MVKEIKVTASKIPLTCIGGVCFNPATGQVDVELDRKSCPPEVVKAIIENMVKGAQVNIIVPPPTKT